METNELRFSNLPQIDFGTDANVGVDRHKQAELIREIDVGLVVRSSRKQDHLAAARADVFLNGAVPLPLAVAEVVAFVDEHEPKPSRHVGQFLRGSA